MRRARLSLAGSRVWHLVERERLRGAEGGQRAVGVEARVVVGHQQEEAVAAGELEAGHAEDGWCGRGRPLSASMPSTHDSAAARIVHSKVTGMNAGQLCSGLPPMFSG